ncbi:MAG: hypothetical protein Q8R00_03900 [Candidatus Nanoarchaeia archaeon]|nr:hypothetical protein [Candidatus Nanoarchaeia archaeon]
MTQDKPKQDLADICLQEAALATIKLPKSQPINAEIHISSLTELSPEARKNLTKTPYQIQPEKEKSETLKDQQKDCPHYMSSAAALYRKPGEELPEDL